MEAEVRARAAEELAAAKLKTEAADIEEARKQAQLKAQEKPFKSCALPVKPDHRRPSRAEIIALVSNHFGLTTSEAIVCLMNEFSAQDEAA